LVIISGSLAGMAAIKTPSKVWAGSGRPSTRSQIRVVPVIVERNLLDDVYWQAAPTKRSGTSVDSKTEYDLVANGLAENRPAISKPAINLSPHMWVDCGAINSFSDQADAGNSIVGPVRIKDFNCIINYSEEACV
jgi:hypothetical protein